MLALLGCNNLSSAEVATIQRLELLDTDQVMCHGVSQNPDCGQATAKCRPKIDSVVAGSRTKTVQE